MGTKARRALVEAIVVLAWRALNLHLTFHRGQSGREVSWIGSRLVMSSTGVVAQMQGETVV